MGAFSRRQSFRAADRIERMNAAMSEPFSFGEAMFENIGQGFLDSYGIGTMVRATVEPGNVRERMGMTPEQYYGTLWGDPQERAASEPRSMSEDEYKASPWYREAVPYDRGMTEARAQALAEFADQRATRAHFSEKQPIAAFLGQFAGQMFDPINYIPVFGPAAHAATVARLGSITGRIALGASEAAINTAAFGMLTSGIRQKMGDDVSFEAMSQEIAMSALIGGAFGAGVGAFLRGREGVRQRQAMASARESMRTAAQQQQASIALNGPIDSLATTGEVSQTANGMDAMLRAQAEFDQRTAGSRDLTVQTARVVGNKPGEVVVTPTGRRVAVRAEVVELDTLIRAEGQLQVRNRRNAASAAQVEDIAINLDPARLMPNISADLGAPLVGLDNIVDSGNGRVMAIRRAAEAYPDKYAAYVEHLRAEGYAVDGMRQPVLINRRMTDLSAEARAQFNAEANSSSTARMSAVELAQMDRDAVTDDVLDVLANAPVTAASNRAFVQRFLAQLPQNERGALVDETGGGLSADGVRRIENALVATAYGDVDEAVVRRFAEANDDNTRSIVGAMSDMAGRWAKLRRDAKAGVLGPEHDMTVELTQALRLIGRWRDQAAREGRAVSMVIREGMAQMDLLSGDIPAEGQVFIRMFYQNDHFAKATGREALGEWFEHIIESAYELGRPSLFGDALPNVSKMEVLLNAIRRNEQIDRFASGDLVSRFEEKRSLAIGDPAGTDRGGYRQGDRQGAEGEPAAEGLAEAAEAEQILAEQDIFASAAPTLPFRSASERDAAELMALAEAGDIAGIKRSEALMRVTDEMRNRPATDQAPGYGSQEWADSRVYVDEQGNEIVGVEAAQDHLLTNARTLAATELGIAPYPIRAERKAVIIIGPPAAGKSTIGNQIALRLGAAIPDPDEAKKLMPEYDGGIGSGATHEESSFLSRYVLDELAEAGENMVIPKVGGSTRSIEKLAADLKEAGYSVDLALMDVEPVEAFRRMITRFVRTGRLIPPDYFDEVAAAPPRVYDELQAKGGMDGYTRIESARGVSPRISETTGGTLGFSAGDEIPIGSGGGSRGAGGRGVASSEGAAPPAIVATPAAPDPAPDGLAEAEARLGTTEDGRALREQFGVDEGGGYIEQGDIEQLRAEGQLLPEEVAALAEADQVYADADVYAETMTVAARCVV